MQDATGVATQQDLLQLRTDVTVAQQRAQRALGEAEAALAQAQRRERERDTETERRVAALAQRVEALTASLTTLSNQLDELNGKLDAASRQPRAGTPPTSAPRTAVPAPPTATPSTSTTPSTTPAPQDSTTPPATAPPAPPPVASRPTTNALQPQDIYQAAYLDFSKGSYALAIAGFREFLRRFPVSGGDVPAVGRERAGSRAPGGTAVQLTSATSRRARAPRRRPRHAPAARTP